MYSSINFIQNSFFPLRKKGYSTFREKSELSGLKNRGIGTSVTVKAC